MHLCIIVQWVTVVKFWVNNEGVRHRLTSMRSLHRWMNASTCAKTLFWSSSQPSGENLSWILEVYTAHIYTYTQTWRWWLWQMIQLNHRACVSSFHWPTGTMKAIQCRQDQCCTQGLMAWGQGQEGLKAKGQGLEAKGQGLEAQGPLPLSLKSLSFSL